MSDNTEADFTDLTLTNTEFSSSSIEASPRGSSIPLQFIDPTARSLYPTLDRATDGSCAFDLRNTGPSFTLEGYSTKLVNTGIKLDMTAYPGLGALVLPRSGLGVKHGIVLGNLVGLIDNDYQGEILVSLWNRTKTEFNINHGERIAQLAFVPFALINLFEVDTFDRETQRGDGGFGHTGNH